MSSTFGATVVVVVVDVVDVVGAVAVVVDVLLLVVVSTFSVDVTGSVTADAGSVVISATASGASSAEGVGSTLVDSFEATLVNSTLGMLIRTSAIPRHSLSRARECISKHRADKHAASGKATNTTPTTDDGPSTAVEDRSRTAAAGYRKVRGLSTHNSSSDIVVQLSHHYNTPAPDLVLCIKPVVICSRTSTTKYCD